MAGKHRWRLALRPRRKSAVSCLFALLGVLLGRPLLAADLTCFSTVFEPFVIAAEDGSIHGIDVDVLHEVGVRLGLELDIALMPWLRLEQNLRQGSAVDCAFAYSLTGPRQAYMQYTQVPLHTTSYTLFYRREQIPDYQALADLQGKRVGVNRGFRRPPEFDQALEQGIFSIYEVTEDSQSLRMLAKGRVDAVLANADVGKYLIKKYGLSVDIVAAPPISQMPTFLVFAKKPGLDSYVQRFDAVLTQMQADGSYQRIFDHYTKAGVSQIGVKSGSGVFAVVQ